MYIDMGTGNSNEWMTESLIPRYFSYAAIHVLRDKPNISNFV